MLSMFQIKNPNVKSAVPMANSFPAMTLVSDGIEEDACEYFKIYVIRNMTSNTMLANTA